MTAERPDKPEDDEFDNINAKARELYRAYKSAKSTSNQSQFRAAVFELAKRRLSTFIRQRLRVKGQADQKDVFQETFLRFMRREPDLDDPKIVFLPYLFTIAANFWIDKIRKERRRNEASVDRQMLNLPDAAGSNQSARLVQRAVQDALDDLPPKWSHVAYEHFVNGRTQAAIAQDLNVNRSTVEHWVRKARQRLQADVRMREMAGKRSQQEVA